ncbi:MAG: hypothetical protein R3C19_14130 [Planctomycetaceae bacterium]
MLRRPAFDENRFTERQTDMDDQIVKFARLPLTIVVLCAALIAGAAVGEDQTASESENVVAPQQLVDIFSLRADVRKLLKAQSSFTAISGDGEVNDEFLFGILDVIERQKLLVADSPAFFRCDLSATWPEEGLAVTAVAPIGRDRIHEWFDEDPEKFEEASDGITMIDGTPVLIADDYTALLQCDTPIAEDRLVRLNRVLKETRELRHQKMASLSSQPRQIGRSALKPFIASFRAGLAADAQRRDNESDFDFSWRSLYQRSVLALVDVFFNDIERLEYSLDWSEADESLVFEVKIEAAKKSSLDQYVDRVRSGDSRALSWLHPDHEMFATATVPIPAFIQELLPEVGKATAVAVQQEWRLSDGTREQIGRFFSDIGERGRLDALIQTIPVSDGSRAIAGVLPLDVGGSLSPAVVELVSATGGFDSSVPTTDIGGWPLHRMKDFDAFQTTGASGDCDLFLVVTENAIAWIIGTEKSIPVLETIVLREFQADAEGDRFRRCAFAAKSSAASLLRFSEFADNTKERVPKHVADQAPRDNIRITLDTEPHTLLLTAHFERDATLLGLQAFNFVTLSLLELLDL